MATCETLASYRYTWPGKDEAFICTACSLKLRAVAEAMELHLQLIKLGDDKYPCSQEVTGQLCITCNGCGLVANDEERTPWIFWAELEPPAAALLGMVRPETCEICKGAGRLQ